VLEKGQREKQMDKGEHKREDTRGRAQAKKITKTEKVRVLYWNVAGLRTKEEFWDYVRQFEIVGLVETWVKEWSWGKNRKVVT
jgi:hypothetical protein